MTDKELLELAAKAAGIEVRYQPISHRFLYEKDLPMGEGKYFAYWEPFTDDGDALRLAVKLNIDISHSWVVVSGDDRYPMASIHAHCNEIESFYELKESDPYAATRRAIVNVAAEIGKAMK